MVLGLFSDRTRWGNGPKKIVNSSHDDDDTLFFDRFEIFCSWFLVSKYTFNHMLHYDNKPKKMKSRSFEEKLSFDRKVISLRKSYISKEKWHFNGRVTFPRMSDISTDEWYIHENVSFPRKNDISTEKLNFQGKVSFPRKSKISRKSDIFNGKVTFPRKSDTSTYNRLDIFTEKWHFHWKVTFPRKNYVFGLVLVYSRSIEWRCPLHGNFRWYTIAIYGKLQKPAPRLRA